MRALVAAVDAMPAQRRSVVISGAGDRRDDDIRDQTVILGDAFDDVILFEDACQRGRADGEVMKLLRQGLAMPSARATASTRSAANSSPSTTRWQAEHAAASRATCA
jgi:UDP-N-acetylmuramyl tripeptide synthase